MSETQRRLNEYEAEKVKLNNLSRSDRALIIHGFQGVFAAFALLFIVLGIQPILVTKELGDFLNGREILQLAIWILCSLVCIAAAKSFQKIAEHPKSLERIDAKITKLKNKLLGG